ncbi:MAG: type VI secretion system tube protein Hcp [Nitrosopumilus sp.]|nr:type VI secretion system tube protein Hcp [Nitrosopumilus sp.]
MTNKTTLMVGVILGTILITGFSINDASAAVFAKYDGVDGESKDTTHPTWIDILNVEWGVHKQSSEESTTKRQGQVIVEDIRLTMEFEKSTVKLLEKMNLGEVIPKLEIEQTATYGGERVVYIKYELKNVMVTSFDVNASGNDESPPSVTIANNFEEYKVTYTEYDDEGGNQGNTETKFPVGKRGR